MKSILEDLILAHALINCLKAHAYNYYLRNEERGGNPLRRFSVQVHVAREAGTYAVADPGGRGGNSGHGPNHFSYKLWPLPPTKKLKKHTEKHIKLTLLAECLDPPHDVAQQKYFWIRQCKYAK